MEHISIYSHPSRPNCRYFELRQTHFPDREVSVEVNSNFVIIRAPTLDDSKTFKLALGKTGWQRFTIGQGAHSIPTGRFLIDKEESNEDQLVIYFEDEI